MVIIHKETLDEKVTQFWSDSQIDELEADPIKNAHANSEHFKTM
jgi:hypothetical protein